MLRSNNSFECPLAAWGKKLVMHLAILIVGHKYSSQHLRLHETVIVTGDLMLNEEIGMK